MTTRFLPGMTTRYGIAFQEADDRLAYDSHQDFGHDEEGGSIGIADPWHDIAYAQIPRRMSFPGGADSRALGLVGILRECVAVT